MGDIINDDFWKACVETDIKNQLKEQNKEELIKKTDKLKGKYSNFINGKLFYKKFEYLENKVPNRETGFTVSYDNRYVDKDGNLSEILKMFTYYENVTQLYNNTFFVIKGQGDTRMFYEVIENHHKCKPYFDIDMKTNLEHADKLIIVLLEAIKIEMLNKLPIFKNEEHTLIFTSHDDKKKSFHIIIDHYCFNDFRQVKRFFEKVRNRLPSEYWSYLDGSVYNNKRSFRMYLSHKLDTTRTKQFYVKEADYYETYNPAKLDASIREIQEAVFPASLITNTNNCLILSDYEVKPTFDSESTEFTEEEWDRIELLWQGYKDYKSFKFTKGDVYLKRKFENYCPLHNRVHQNNNGTLSTWKGSLYFTCWGDPIEKINLGVMIPYVAPAPVAPVAPVAVEKLLSKKDNGWHNLTYEDMKAKFEETNFKCVTRGVYYEIKNDHVIVRSETKLKEAFCHLKYMEVITDGGLVEVGAFIRRWIIDSWLKTYDYVELLPPPLSCPDNTYNLWNGFRISKVVVTDDEQYEKEVDFLLKHLKNVFGKEHNYVFDWLALYFQQPGRRPNVALLLKSLEGLGKGSVIDLLYSLCGHQYVYLAKNLNYVFGNFNSVIEGKLVVAIDEIDFKSFKKWENEIKDYITKPIMTINHKGIDPYEIKNHVHLLQYTNQPNAFIVNDSSRRYVLLDSSDQTIPSTDYFDTLYEIYKNDNILKKIYDFFMSRDISNFKPNDKPDTEFAAQLRQINRSTELNFFIDYFVNRWTSDDEKDWILSTADIFKLFTNYLVKAYPSNTNTGLTSYTTNINSFGIKFKNLKVEGVNQITGANTRYSFNPSLIHRWLFNKKYILELLTINNQ